MRRSLLSLLVASGCLAFGAVAWAAPPNNATPPISQRFAQADGEEVPDFQRHVAPLLGRLGCNGRSCHGSFQGRGGFRLSLFGFDFKFDHEALTKGDKPRVNLEQPLESLIIAKPTDDEKHEGGQRYEKDSWQYHVFVRWIKSGAKYDEQRIDKLERLEITPPEILSRKAGETIQLKAVAVWADGTREDVTPLCRFQTNDEQIAKIDAEGRVTTGSTGGDTHVVAFYDNAVVPVPVIRPVNDKFGPKYPKIATPTKVDELVVSKLRKLGIVPSEGCTDGEFLRRVSLDLTGTLPTAAEVTAFLADPSPNKRAEKINQLLETPAYAAWWTTKLCDYTGNNEQQLNNVNPVQGSATQAWYDWIYKRVADNTPYDQIVEGIVLGVSRAPDQSYTDYCKELSDIYRQGSDRSYADRPSMPYYWARNNFRLPEDRVIGFAYAFMGVRIQCAQCHKHPFDQWSKDDFDRFKGFFTQVRYSQTGPKDEMEAILKELGITDAKGNDLRRKLPDQLKAGKTVPFPEIVATPVKGNNKGKGGGATPTTARLLDGEVITLSEFPDVRKPLMDWLRSKDNPYFAKALVNRVWASYFNVGIVQPPDDLSLANPPSNQTLLDHLAQGFIEHKFDLKWLHREILTSATYQRSWHTNATNALDERNFSHSVPRRLPAEVAYDALQQATASDSKAAEALSDVKRRAIAIAGVGNRNNGPAGDPARAFALQVFGRSIRESNCDCDRSMDASLLQTVFLQNDESVMRAINGGKDSWIEQLSRTVDGKPTAAEEDSKRKKSAASKELAQLKIRLTRAEKDKDEAKIAKAKERIEELEKSLADAPTETPAVETPKLTSEDIVRQLYLRTLSRVPTDEERTRCQEFLASSASPVEGAKGLLWALVNTKEFIVNH